MATTARIDVGFRVGPGTNTIRVAYPTGTGYTAVTVASGLYLTAATLAAAVDTALKTKSANLSCVNSGRTFTIATAALNFDIEILQLTLKGWLGVFDGANIASTAGNCPGIFVSAWPWRGYAPTWVRNRKVAIADHGHARVIHLSAWREWRWTVLLGRAEVTTFRAMMSYILRGQPFTLYPTTATTTAWSWSSYYGTRTLVLTSDAASAPERWLSSPHQTYAELDLVAREFAP